MTATEANHQVGLTMNSEVIDPWSELMVSEPDQLAENAHYCQAWSHWLLVMRDVWCTCLFLSVVGTEFQPWLLWPWSLALLCGWNACLTRPKDVQVCPIGIVPEIIGICHLFPECVEVWWPCGCVGSSACIALLHNTLRCVVPVESIIWI